MVEIEARLDELRALGLHRRTRLVSGPQGPHVLLDGKPVLLLCSNNYLGLADHPRVREAAAEAAMRWGVGTGSSRLASGTMTIHRRLEERLAAFQGRESALLFGSGYLAGAGVIAALARPGDVVFSDECNQASIVDGCHLSQADVFVYDHGDVEHLDWGIRQAEGRGAVIATEAVFALDGDVAPLQELVELGQRHRIRLVVDQSHAIGALGPDGRGLLAELGLEDQVDVIVGTLAAALGGYGAFVACDRHTARFLVNHARTFIHSTSLPPTAVAGALAALDLLENRPRLVARLRANATALRDQLSLEGLASGSPATHILALLVEEPAMAIRICDSALARGVFTQAIVPPAGPDDAARLRLAVMATHREEELRAAARTLAQVARSHGFDPRTAPRPLFDGAPDPDDAQLPAGSSRPAGASHSAGAPRPAGAPRSAGTPRSAGVFDFERPETRAA